MTVGNRLKMLRLEKRLTLQEVATRIGLAKSSYASYEGGHRNPPIDKLIELAQLYHVSTDYLLKLTDIPDSVESLQKQHLQWDGIRLSEKELEIVHQVVVLITEKHQENNEEKLRHMNSV
ncbi:helix-turn-helix domain-containing protein [Sporosarcina siberiensis]|uniref:Helix-turn-helix domain-containing protein n=1 Tax=Sporosarcina siberiensis TaxID=1365606 RepID=A0ABW4SFM5_9BACL